VSIFQMSVAASILIILIVTLRRFIESKMSKKTFMFLWGIALLRLLLPFYIPIYTSVARPITSSISVIENAASGLLWMNIIWIIGAIVLALMFVLTHIRHCKEYMSAIPIESEFINNWMARQNIKRIVRVRQSDRINAPLVFGVLRPVILFPKTTNWQDEEGLAYVLAHEMAHIRRYDLIKKWLLAAVLCLHWFNPLVWIMYILANRDIEFACDEAVVKSLDKDGRTGYALTLVGLEENRSLSPSFSGFSKKPIEKRIVAIMKMGKTSVFGIIISIVAMFGAISVVAATSVGQCSCVLRRNYDEFQDLKSYSVVQPQLDLSQCGASCPNIQN